MKIGDIDSNSKLILEDDVRIFGDIVGDTNPIHIDPVYAASTIFKERVVQGMLIGSLISGVLGTKLPGPGCIYLKQTMSFLKPVKINDMITAKVEVVEIKQQNDHSSIVVLKTWCINQYCETVVSGEAIMKV